jgi:hypothetical protein
MILTKHACILARNSWPAELVLVRDVFQHLRLDGIKWALDRLRRTKFKWLVTTSYRNGEGP